ncbi:MAG: aminotransferase class IV [Egibacteraceae bacterium]
MEAIASIDGTVVPLAEARLAVTDEGVARGDGAFETVGVWDGRPFRLPDHLDRLARSLAAVALPPVDPAALTAEVEQVLDGAEADGALRLYVTGSGTRVVTLSPSPPGREVRRLVPQPAPWIRPLGTYGPAGAKTMSYLPNMVATRAARAAGADDALLVSLEGWVLEGPTFAVLWVAGGSLYAPPPSLGTVDSISRRTLLELAAAVGIDVIDEPLPLDHLLVADEVMAVSSVRDLVAVERVGEQTFDGPTPLRDQLADGLWAARRGR